MYAMQLTVLGCFSVGVGRTPGVGDCGCGKTAPRRRPGPNGLLWLDCMVCLCFEKRCVGAGRGSCGGGVFGGVTGGVCVPFGWFGQGA